jgi:hypothetical protein
MFWEDVEFGQLFSTTLALAPPLLNGGMASKDAARHFASTRLPDSRVSDGPLPAASSGSLVTATYRECKSFAEMRYG